MKLDEISWSQNPNHHTDFGNIEDYIHQLGLKNAKVGRDYKINVMGNVELHRDIMGLRYPFGYVTGDFKCAHAQLRSCKNFPTAIGGMLELGDHITDITGITRTLKSGLYADMPPVFKSLVGIADMFDEIQGQFVINFSKVEKGGLGLMNIPKLVGLREYAGSYFPTPFVIIDKHMRGNRDIFQCQNELIESDLEAFAEL